jgi:hypothetical protein
MHDEADTPLPAPEQVLDLVRQWPGVSLRQLCALLWPDLSWEDAIGRPGAAGSEPPALWLRQVLRELLRANRVQLGPYQRDQPGLAGLTYLIPSG